MVTTRQNNVSGDSPKDMPVKNYSADDGNTSNQHNGPNDRSPMDNDSDFEPLVSKRSERTRWRREQRSRYSSNYGMERDTRHYLRSSRMRSRVTPKYHYDDDLLDESDIEYNEEDFIPVKRRQNYRRMTRRLDRRRDPPEEGDDDGPNNESNLKIENGVKDDDEDEDIPEGEEAGVRRSKRQRKLIYGSYNPSWILGTPTLRGYPDMYESGRRENADNTSNSNEEANIDKPANPVNDVKTEGGDDEDMYTKVKRTRQTRMRYSPEVEIRPRLRPRERNRTNAEDSPSMESETGGTSDDEAPRGQRRVYHLRQNKPIVDRFQISSNEPRRSSRLVLCSVRRRPTFQRKRRDSSSSDEERFQRKKALSLAKARSRCLPLNYKPSEAPSHQRTPIHSSKPVAGGSGPKGPADVDPMTIDTSVTFEKVGGLEGHLRCLKEMVVFPMLYREIFEKFHVQPPKGILFHGPPGTGKTLIARALANECSQGDRKVAFFMRKGADCLSKWVGESERQLRLLFEQAYQMRPSIIFFDEIDGLAPVRSSKQDQIHASIVSTLLALLDGLDDRGDIIVIGATNRIDAIDPALRRPGRFDRELYFPLPGKKERIDILRIHTKPWAAPPETSLIEDLAERSVGYCGSDLRLLCTEAVIGAMRRRYPQVYRSSKKLLLKPDQIQVQNDDFKQAHSKIVPASCRVTACPRARLPSLVAPLLQAQFDTAKETLQKIYPYASVTSVNDRLTRGVYKPRLMIHAPTGEYGQTSYLAPALLDLLEHVPVHLLGLDTLLDTTNRSPEEAVIQIIREATRNPPSIVYLPAIDTWWDLVPPTTHRILLDRIAQISAEAAVLLLATVHSKFDDLEDDIKSIFRYDFIEVRKPTLEERKSFFEPLLLTDPFKDPPPVPLPEEEWEELPEAPPPTPPAPSAKEIEELYNAEEHRLRELRLFLRDICAKLVRNRQFFMFSKPVDVKEVPDYLNIIEKPMDLETIMTNIDLRYYNSAQEFLADIDLIVANALEYNPERDPEDKLIRHRACSLRDTAYTLIKAEMDTDFEEECRKISRKRKDAKNNEKKTETAPSTKTLDDAAACNGASESTSQSSISAEEAKRRRLSAQGVKPLSSLLSAERVRRRKSNWARGMLKKKSANKTKNKLDEGGSTTTGSGTPTEQVTNASTPVVAEPSETPPVKCSSTENSGKHAASSPLERETKRSKSASAETEPMDVNQTTPTKQSPIASAEETTPKKKARKSSIKRLTMNQAAGVIIEREKLEILFNYLVETTEGWTVEMLVDCSARIRRVLDSYSELYDRQSLPQELDGVVKAFVDAHA